MKFKSIKVIMLVCYTTYSCAAEPEESSPGSCTLNCSKKRVGAVEYSARPLFPASAVSIPCSLQGAQNGVAAHNGPIQVRYLVYETVPPFTQLPESQGGGGGGSGGSTGGGSLTPILNAHQSSQKSKSLQMTRLDSHVLNPADLMLQGAPLAEILPKAGIGFEPALFGVMSVDKTNAEFKPTPNEVTPFKFAGVVTPSSEWCTDSCGIATYEFWPNCISSGQTIQSGIYIQNTPVEEVYSFSMTPI